MLRRDGVRRDSAGPPARRRPKTPSPSVTPAGVGGPRAAESREPPRRRGGRAAERRLRDPCPPAPPPRGAPAPPGPGSQEASLPRPADQLRCRAGAGVMEETPPPQFGRTKAVALRAAGRGPARSAGTVRARPRPPAGESARRAGEERAPRRRAGRGRAASAGLSPPPRGSARMSPPFRTRQASHPVPPVWLVTRC